MASRGTNGGDARDGQASSPDGGTSGGNARRDGERGLPPVPGTVAAAHPQPSAHAVRREQSRLKGGPAAAGGTRRGGAGGLDEDGPGGTRAGIAFALVAGTVIGGYAALASTGDVGAPDWLVQEGAAASPEARLNEIDAALSDDPGDAAAAAPRLTSIEGSIAELGREVAAVREAVSNLEAATSPASAADDAGAAAAGAVDDLSDAVSALSARVDRIADLAQATPQLSQAIDSLRGQVSDLSGRVGDDISAAIAAAPFAQAGTVATLQSGLQSVEGAVSSLRDGLSTLASRLETATSANQTAIQRLSGNVGDLADIAKTGIAVAAISDALETGAPYARELAVLRASGADPDLVAAAEPLAADGVPTRAALLARFRTLALGLVRPAGGDDGDFLSGLVDSASGLLAVRRTGEDADGLEGKLARIEARVAEGDLAAALEAWAALPEDARQATSDWHAALAARHALGELAERASGTALATEIEPPSPAAAPAAAPGTTTPGGQGADAGSNDGAGASTPAANASTDGDGDAASAPTTPSQ